MRILTLAMITTAAVLTAVPARAQAYDPDYPVCLRVYGRGGGYISCRYTSMAQCALTASGRPAQCIVNPYFAGAQKRPGSAYRRHRQVNSEFSY
jgi:hypothetical protein